MNSPPKDSGSAEPNKFTKSDYADTLNALVVMQESFIYAARRKVLNDAERIIVKLEEQLRAARAAPPLEGWKPIETAPRVFIPPLSTMNHHAPDILGLWGQAFYCVCSWGGPSAPFWIGGDNKRVPFQPTYWMPLPAPPEDDASVHSVGE